MNIPNSPDELLREYHKESKQKKKCDCKVCSAMRAVSALDLNAYEAILLQGLIGEEIMDALFKATRILADHKDFPASMAMSHLAGQISIVLTGIQGCMRTVKVINEIDEL